ncbi:DNA topoisomerase [Methanosalsum natronophilum]|uniref:DNA topoisomerase n=1 Tax=Methanosalsum natronophilum TaxID=768733 RepID=UPI002167D45E|nr:DNA topoisomerase [Methanosalsum natronophilum]MCS3923007.1 DNA topoisomerase-1 [Methanosalsum natronophilum]
MSTLIIAEKNKAAEKIASILGNHKYCKKYAYSVPYYEFELKNESYVIIGLAGHIMGYDFPEKYKDWNSIDPKFLINITPEKYITKKKYADAIQKLATSAHKVILACDFDREGENIGFEAKKIIESVSNIPFKRAKFSSLSSNEILNSFNSLTEINENMAMAAEARQILDLKMGVIFTRYLTISVQSKIRTRRMFSIGPCQTPTCGFVYEREKRIKNFESTDFWKLEAIFSFDKIKFNGIHRKGKITEKEEAVQEFNEIKKLNKAKVINKTTKENTMNPPLPLNTTELLKKISIYFGLSPEEALTIAEDLYLAGFISYPRTETNQYSTDFNFKEIVEAFKNSEYSSYIKKLPKSISPNNGKNNAQDHPPIHPIKAVSNKKILNNYKDSSYWNVYNYIVLHFFSNLMPPAIFEKTKLTLSIKNSIFDSKGSVLKEIGWLEMYPFEDKKDKTLPLCAKGDVVEVIDISCENSQTTPPRKMTEAELLTLMEKNNIGTKATSSGHIETNKIRGYLEKKGRTISISDQGYILMDSLNAAAPIIVKPEVRANIETLIQNVESGKDDFNQVILKGIDEIKSMFNQLVAKKEIVIDQLADSIYDEYVSRDEKNVVGKCTKCNRILRIIKTENGRFVGCTGFPSCKNTFSLPKKGSIVVAKKALCKKGAPAVLKVGRKFHWALSIGPCFKCELEKECFPPDIVGACLNCDGYLFVINTESGRFLGCSNKCGFTHSLPKKGRLSITSDFCKICNWKIVRVKESKTDPFVGCINRKCIKK